MLVSYWPLVKISVGGRESRSARKPYPSTFQDSSYANPHAPRPAGQTWWSTRASPGSRDADATRAPVWDWQLRDLATSTVTFVFWAPTFFTSTAAPRRPPSRRRGPSCPFLGWAAPRRPLRWMVWTRRVSGRQRRPRGPTRRGP